MLNRDREIPTFSVVIPCFNRSKLIRNTLESVQTQSNDNFECIVVDDGSTDAVELKAQVESLGDARFKYVYQTNQGGGAARNTGISASRGRFIAFLDSDDLFAPNKLEVVSKFVEATGAQAVYSQAYVRRGGTGRLWVRPERGIHPEEDMGEYLFVANQFVQTSTIVVSATIAKSVMFDPDLKKGQDLDFCVRAHSMGIRFTMIDEPLVIWSDTTELGRTSRHAGAAVLLDWMNAHNDILTDKAKLGYRATIVTAFRPKRQIGLVVRDLFLAAFIANVSFRVVSRQFLRFALPRSTYRWLVDAFVGIRGRRPNGNVNRCL